MNGRRCIMEKHEVIQIKKEETYEWLTKRHYAKRIPNIMFAFGLYKNNILIGVITYGMPPSPSLCVGICGIEYKNKVIELNRLCLLKNYKNHASYLISKSLKLLPQPSVVVSYADTSMNHIGYVYQASNFIYSGLSAKRTDVDTGEKHARHCENFDISIRKNRPQKHRYIYFVANKKQKKHLLQSLNYKILPYPKGNNLNYKTEYTPKTQGLLF